MRIAVFISHSARVSLFFSLRETKEDVEGEVRDNPESPICTHLPYSFCVALTGVQVVSLDSKTLLTKDHHNFVFKNVSVHLKTYGRALQTNSFFTMYS